MSADTNPKMNGKYLKLERSETGSDLSHGDALLIRRACDRWLQKNDPGWLDPSRFDFGSFNRRSTRRAA